MGGCKGGEVAEELVLGDGVQVGDLVVAHFRLTTHVVLENALMRCMRIGSSREECSCTMRTDPRLPASSRTLWQLGIFVLLLLEVVPEMFQLEQQKNPHLELETWQ